jgi:Ca-activated chloride channel homolog
MSKSFVSYFLMICAISFGSVQSAMAAEKIAKAKHGRVMMVLDASGSMWGQISGKPKIQIAREVVRDLMKDWDETLNLGLSAYGHRRKGDCQDIQTLIPLGKADPKKVVSIVNALQPKGMTPLSEAVKRAAQELKYEKEQAIVILVSDGEENCKANPCELGKALEAAGVDFTTHVVGFDVAKSKQAGLRCLAKNTGGSFFAAKDAGELHKALTGVLQQTKKVSGPNLKFRAVLKEGGKPLRRETLLWLTSWNIVKAEAEAKKKRQQVAYSSDAQVGFEIPAGQYIANLNWDTVKVAYPFEVKQDEREEHIINLNAGIATLTAILHEGGPVIKRQVGWSFYQAKEGGGLGKELTYNSGNKRMNVLPAGQLIVVAKLDNVKTKFPFTVEAGSRKEHIINLNAGNAHFSVADSSGAKVKGYRTWNVYPANSGGKGKYVAFKGGIKPRFVLSAGRYQMLLTFNKKKYLTDFEVKAGETMKFTVGVPAQ